MSAYSLFLARRISGHSGLICTYWGSDLHRHPVQNDDADWCLRKAKHVVVPTIEMCEKFLTMFGNEHMGKLRIIKFCVNGFDYIDKIESSITCRVQTTFGDSG